MSSLSPLLGAINATLGTGGPCLSFQLCTLESPSMVTNHLGNRCLGNIRVRVRIRVRVWVRVSRVSVI